MKCVYKFIDEYINLYNLSVAFFIYMHYCTCNLKVIIYNI